MQVSTITIHQSGTDILVTCIGKNNDRKTLECRNQARPLNDPYWSSINHCVTFGKMIHYQHHKISYGY
jgi:hypothetical protein